MPRKCCYTAQTRVTTLCRWHTESVSNNTIEHGGDRGDGEMQNS